MALRRFDLKIIQRIDALLANAFALMDNQIMGASTEQASGFILLQDDPVPLQENLELVSLFNVAFTAITSYNDNNIID